MSLKQEKIGLGRQLFKFLPLTIGIETLGGVFTPLILRGTPLPANRYQTFSTATDNQKAITAQIYIGERPIAQKNIILAEFELQGISEAPKGAPQINLNIFVEKDLSIKANAVESKSGAKVSVDTHEPDINFTQKKLSRYYEKQKKIKSLIKKN